jgi:hypothetical protein
MSPCGVLIDALARREAEKAAEEDAGDVALRNEASSHLAKSSLYHLRSNRVSMPTSAFGGGNGRCVCPLRTRSQARCRRLWTVRPGEREDMPKRNRFRYDVVRTIKIARWWLRDRAAAIMNLSDAEPMRFAPSSTYSRFDRPGMSAFLDAVKRAATLCPEVR